RLPGTFRRQFGHSAPFNRRRRQLGFAFRPASDRPRKGAHEAGWRRHQTLQLQRRNTILMRKILLLAAIAATTAIPSAVHAQVCANLLILGTQEGKSEWTDS